MENLPGAEPQNCLWSHEHTLPSFSSLCRSLSASPHLIFPSLDHFSPALQRWEPKASDATHYFQQRTCCTEEKRETGWTVCFAIFFSRAIISNHERPDGYAEHLWLWGAQVIPPPPPRVRPVSAPQYFSAVGLTYQSFVKRWNMIQEFYVHIWRKFIV